MGAPSNIVQSPQSSTSCNHLVSPENDKSTYSVHQQEWETNKVQPKVSYQITIYNQVRSQVNNHAHEEGHYGGYIASDVKQLVFPFVDFLFRNPGIGRK